MKYSLPMEIKSISCSVVFVMEGKELRYDNGLSAVEHYFDRWYIVDKMYARNDEIVVVLKENEQINDTNWCGEEQISFF